MDESTILLRHKVDAEQISFFQREPLEQVAYYPSLGVQALSVPDYLHSFELIAYLRSTGKYDFVEPNLIQRLPATRKEMLYPDVFDDSHQYEQALLGKEKHSRGLRSGTPVDDPMLSYQWNMEQIQIDDISSDYWGSGITVAVIDTGVSSGTDGYGNLGAGYDFVNNDSDPSDDNGHGSHVAGTIAQATNNGVGVRGVAPNATIMPLKTLDADGIGSTLYTIEAIQYAADNGADILNLSLVSSVSSAAEQAAIDYAIDAGAVVIAATGNDGITSNGVGYPAAYSTTIAVSSVGYNRAITDYSNAGPEVNFTAPGGDVDVDLNGDGYVDGILQEDRPKWLL